MMVVNMKLLAILSIVNSALALYIRCPDRDLPVADLSISLIKSDNNSFERELQMSLEQSENLFERIEAVFDDILLKNGPGVVPEVMPPVSSAMNVIKLVISEPNEKDWVKPLLDSVKQYVDAGIPYDSVRAQLQDVKEKMKSLNRILEIVTLNVTERDIMLNNLLIAEDILHALMKNLLDPTSLFQRFPLVAVRPLFGIAAFLPPFEALKYEWKQYIVKPSDLSCTFSKILLEYRTFAVTDRIRWLKTIPRIFKPLKNVSQLPYSCAGYIASTENLTCSRPTNADQQSERFPHIWDHFDDKFYPAPIAAVVREDVDYLFNDKYVAKIGEITYECIEGFLKVLRQRIEGAFVKPLAVVDKVCANVNRAKLIYSSNSTGLVSSSSS